MERPNTKMQMVHQSIFGGIEMKTPRTPIYLYKFLSEPYLWTWCMCIGPLSAIAVNATVVKFKAIPFHFQLIVCI